MNRKIFKIILALFALTVCSIGFARNKVFDNIRVLRNLSVPNILIDGGDITVYGNLFINGAIVSPNLVTTQGQVNTDSIVLFADNTGKALKGSSVSVNNAGNIALNGITKNGNTVSWPSIVGAAGTVLTSDGAGNLFYAIASGGGNVVASPLFTDNNRLVLTDTASGATNVKQSGVTVNGADITGLNSLTANNVIVAGNLTGNASSATFADIFTGNLSTNVSGAQTSNIVNFVGGQSSVNIQSAVSTIATATSNNLISTVVKRDVNGDFAANIITADLIGSVTGNLSGQATSALSTVSAVNFTQPMFGDVTQTRLAAVVSTVGGKSAAQVAQAAIDAANATDSSTASLIVKRDGSNNFAANIVTANLLRGNVTGNLSGQAIIAITAMHTQDFLGSLTGDVVGKQWATQVNLVGGKTAANVAAATTSMLTATSSNIASTVVRRSINGNFVATKITSDLLGSVTGSLYGNASSATTALSAISVLTATDFLGSFTGDVTGKQWATVVSKVNGKTSSEIANAVDMVASATSGSIPDTIVKRDALGNFIANKISILGQVTNSTDVTTKAYVDNAALGVIQPKQAALAVSTTNFAPLSGPQTIDGVTLIAGNRALLVGQNNGVNNGLWLVQAGSWARPDDFANTTTAGRAYVLTTSGLTEAGSSWLCSTPLSVIGTSTISFDRFSDPGQVTAANVGSGVGKIFRDKSGIIINLKSIAAGNHMVVTNNANDIQIATDATSDNISSTIISRDGLGSFSATLSGQATYNVLKSGDTVTGNIDFVPNAGMRSAVNLYDASNLNFVGLRAPNSLIATYTLDLPSAAPTLGQYLQASSSFITTWTGITASPVNARAFYVSLSGNNLNDGSLSAPFRTIAYAVEQANFISLLSYPVVIFVGAGIFNEDNSGSAIAISANGISIVGSSMSSTIIRPTSLTNDLFSTSVSNFAMANISLQGGGSTGAGFSLNSFGYGKIQLDSIAVNSFGKGFDLHRSSGDYPILFLRNIQCSGNTISVYINNTKVFINGSVFRGPLGSPVAGNTAIQVTGSGAEVKIFESNFLSCNKGIDILGGSSVEVFNCIVESCNNGIISSGGSKTKIIGSNFLSSTDSLSFEADGSNTVAYIEGSMFDSNNSLIRTGTAIRVTDSAFVSACNSAVDGVYTAIECGVNSSEVAATKIMANSLNLLNCTADIVQRGASTLKFIGGTIELPGLYIENPLHVSLASFNSNGRTTLAFGNSFDNDTSIFKIINGQAISPELKYTGIYGSKGMLYSNLNTTIGASFNGLYSQGGSASCPVITAGRDDVASINLWSDTSTNLGDGNNIRGWTLSKAATSGDLLITYTNNDTTGQFNVGPNTIIKLSGANNNVEFPSTTNYPYTTPKLVWASDTNLYRNSAGVLRTDGDIEVDGLAANTLVVTGTNKILVSSAVTDTQLGYLSGIASPVQTQINSKVSKSGDTMTGVLTLPAGLTTNPSLQFTGSTNTGVDAQVANTLSFSALGIEGVRINSDGSIYINKFNAPGIVHNDSAGKLLSSLIVDADIIASAGIVDSKLATISTVGKVANSATSATSINTFGAIVARDALGTFTATTIYANLIGNASSATNLAAVVFAGDVAGPQATTVVNSIGSNLRSAASVAAMVDTVSTATSTNLSGLIVKRDQSTGNFAASMITVIGAITSANQASNKIYADSLIKSMHTGTLLTSGVNTITQDGLYTLTSNITANIVINASDVAIDLGDFTIYSAGPSAVIEVGAGYKNIEIKNGKIKGDATNNGLLINAGCQLINLSNLKVYSCTNGLYCNGNFGSKIIRGKIQNCGFDSCAKGVSLNYTEKMVFRNCEAYSCLYSGFEQNYCKYNICDNCSALETINNTSTNDAIGFSSLGGQGNLFSECLAEGTTKSAGNYTIASLRAIGFLLTGTQGAMENQTKIINSIANTTYVATSSCVAYGVLLDPVLKSETLTQDLLVSYSVEGGSTYFSLNFASASWAPNGKYLALGVSKNNGISSYYTVIVLKLVGSFLSVVANYNLPETTTPSFNLYVKWSLDGRYIAAGCLGAFPLYKDLSVLKFDGSNLTLVNDISLNLIGNPILIASVDWSPDGRFIAVSGKRLAEYQVTVCAFNGTTISELTGCRYQHVNSAGLYVYSVNWSPDGKYLAIGGEAGTGGYQVRVLQFSGSTLAELAGCNYIHGANINSVNWSPDGKYLAIGGVTASSVTIRVLRFDGTSLAPIVGCNYNYGFSIANSVNWSPNGKYLAIGGDLTSNQARIFRFDGLSLSAITSYDHGAAINCVNWSPDSINFAISGTSGTNGWQVRAFEVMQAPYNCLIQENKICDSTSYLSANGGFSRQAIGICASGDNVYLKNVGFANDVNFNSAVYNVYGQSLLSAAPKSSDNLWQPPFEAAYGYSY